MTERVAKKIIAKWQLSKEDQERVREQKVMYAQKAKRVKEHIRVFKQPGNHSNGCCLIVSALNCMKTARARAALLGQRGGKAVDTTALQTYAKYQAFYLEHHPKRPSHQYSIGGLRHWLEHLVKNKILKRFELKYCHTFRQGLASLLSPRMENLQGKSFIVTCDRRATSRKQEDFERLYNCTRVRSLWRAFSTMGVRVRGAKSSNLAQKRQNMAFSRILDHWQAGDQKCDPPVQQLRRCEYEKLRRRAVERALGDYGTLLEWMAGTKRSGASFQIEVYYHLQALIVEAGSVHKSHLAARNKSDTRAINEVTGEERDTVCAGKKKAQKVDNEKELVIETIAAPKRWVPRCGAEEFQIAKEKTNSAATGSAGVDYTPVTSHAIAVHILEDGDVVVADPACDTVRLISRKNVFESCKLFCQLLADISDAYEISVQL